MPISRQSAEAIVDALALAGVDARRLGVTRIEDDRDLATLWQRAIARTGRATLPLEVGLGMPLGVMGVIDYLAAASATVGAALTVTQQVFPLVAPGMQLMLERGRGGARRVVIVNQPPFPGQDESDLLVLGILLGRVRRFASRPPSFSQVDLTVPQTAPRAPWLELLQVGKVHFGARRTAVHVSAGDWALPLRNADPLLLKTLRAMVGAEQRSTDALLVAVRALLTEKLPAALTLDDAASSLGLSRRTLQRKLTASGTSLSGLLDEVRRDRAEQLVGERVLTLGEVAVKVGFAEQASFTRAWTRWFGAPPSRRSRRRRVRQ